MLPSTKTLFYDAFAHAFGLRCSFFWLLSKMTHSSACKTNRMSCWSPPIHWNNHVCLVSQCFEPEHYVQAKNIFLLYSSTKVTCRNTLLNASDTCRFVSQTCFHCQYHCIPLCVQLFDVIHKMEETIRIWILAYFVSWFYHLNEFQKF